MLRFISIAAFIASMSMGPALANEIDIDAIRQKAKQDAGQYAELRQLMRDPDQNIRLAAFEAMVDHGDPALYEIAVSMGLADADEVVRARALWEAISRRTTIVLHADPDKTLAPEGQRTLKATYPEDLVFTIKAIAEGYKCLNFQSAGSKCHRGYSADVSGLVVSFDYRDLSGEMVLREDGILAGHVVDYDRDYRFPVELYLR